MVYPCPPHGKAFKVYDRTSFETTILPGYFKSRPKYRTFQRQLAIYGFEQIKDPHAVLTGENGEYRHPLLKKEDNQNFANQWYGKKLKAKLVRNQ